MQANSKPELVTEVIKISRYLIFMVGILVFCALLFLILLCNDARISGGTSSLAIENKTAPVTPGSPIVTANGADKNLWAPPAENTLPGGKTGEVIRYGRELLAHTAEYFGPKGSIAQISNGMNCQNCHLAGGTRLFANNYASVAATYPKFSYRSGKVASVATRIAECFNRSLAGQVPDTNSKEVQAMLAYVNWLGQGVKKGAKLYGAATEKLPYLAGAADPQKGKIVYVSRCKVCHGSNGAGLLAADRKSYTYPPLWGPHSYNDGAGMYRLGNFAGFVKNNMPFGATYKNPQLTNEEAWNVAAFVNSQPRSHRDQHADWKDLKNKPIDFPFGPYADNFDEHQHKFGPFKPIKDAQTILSPKKPKI